MPTAYEGMACRIRERTFLSISVKKWTGGLGNNQT